MTTTKPCADWIERLSAHADGEAVPRERPGIEQHLAACPACREWLEAVRVDARRYVAAYAEPPRAEAFVEGVLGKLPSPQASLEAQRPATLRERVILWGTALALIAVLAATLFPVFARAREKARQASCNSNVKQLALGMLMFAQDHNDRLPSALTWRRDITPYVGNERLFLCASDDSGQACSYAMNYALSQKDLSTIEAPEQQVMLYEADTAGAPAKRHNDGLVIGFADGRVKWLREPPQPLTGGVSLGAPGRNYGLAEELHLAYDAALTVETRDALSALRAAAEVVREQGGFVLQADFRRVERLATAVLTCKVPAGNLEASLTGFQTLGVTKVQQLAGQDLTQDVVAAAAALRREQDTRARLSREAAAGDEPNITAALRADLTQSEERTLAGRRKQYEVLSQTVLSSVCATFESPVPRQPVRAMTASALRSGWHWSGRTLGVAGAWAVGLAPMWAPVALGLATLRWWRRRRRA